MRGRTSRSPMRGRTSRSNVILHHPTYPVVIEWFIMKFNYYVAAACVLVTSSLFAQTTASPPPATSSLEQQFNTPPRDAKPMVFWMWLGTKPTHQELTRDLEQMKAKGIVGAIIYPSSAGKIWMPGYKMVLDGKEYKRVRTNDYKGDKAGGIPGKKMPMWGPDWMDAVSFSAKEANRLGLDLCVSVGTGAPRSVISPADGGKRLEWSQEVFNGPGTYNGTLHVPQIKMSARARKRLTGKPYYQDIAVLAVPDKPIVNAHDVINISNKMDAQGHVQWMAPAGTWIIYRFAEVATLKGNPSSLEMDGLSANVIDKAWAGTMEKLLKQMTTDERQGLKFIEEDSWEAGTPGWTQTFAAEFNKRRGYDLIPYLPVLAGRTIGSKTTSAQIKEDYRLTLDDLFAINHYGERRKLADADHLQFYSEAAGPNQTQSDLLEDIDHVDVGMAEFWMPSVHRPSETQRFLIRVGASANHVYGKPVTPCEAFTSVGPHWENSLFDMKATGDQAFCDGTNRIVFHNFAQNPSMTAIPGYTMWAGTHYEPGVTWWNQTPAFNAYVSRCSYMLQQGLFSADALFYEGNPFGFVGHTIRAVPPTLGKGYNYDDCNEDVLLHRTSVKDDRIVLTDGMNYSVLILPENKPMRLEALLQIQSLLKAGATVVGPAPITMAGLPTQAGETSRFNQLVKSLWNNSPSGEHQFGSGRVVWNKTARQVMLEENIQPDFEETGLSSAGTMDWIHRSLKDGTEAYFVTSRWDPIEHVECSFRVTGKQPEIWDPVTGQCRDATAFRQENGHTMVPLRFNPRGSMFVVFRKSIAKTTNGTTQSNYPTLTPEMTLKGKWDVHFDPKWGGPARVTFDALTDWTKRSEKGIKFYSGTAVYAKTFNLTSIPAGGHKLILDLGAVDDEAVVKLNGKNLGILWTKPAEVDITSAAKVGPNDLQVSVVNLWPNRLIGDASLPPDKRYTVTNMRKFVPSTPLLPSGLLGPVRIMESRPLK